MKYLIFVLVVISSCSKDYNPREAYTTCLEDRMHEFGSRNKSKTVSIEMLQQAQSACTPILEAKLECPPPK
jgi:hypothetical protein